MKRFTSLLAVLVLTRMALAVLPASQPTSRPATQPVARIGGTKAAAYADFYKAVQEQDPADAKLLPHLQFGIMMQDVLPNGPLDRAGLSKRDILLRCGDDGFKTVEDFKKWLASLQVGKPYVLTVMRDPVAALGKPLKQEKITVVPEAVGRCANSRHPVIQRSTSVREVENITSPKTGTRSTRSTKAGNLLPQT